MLPQVFEGLWCAYELLYAWTSEIVYRTREVVELCFSTVWSSIVAIQRMFVANAKHDLFKAKLLLLTSYGVDDIGHESSPKANSAIWILRYSMLKIEIDLVSKNLPYRMHNERPELDELLF